MDSLVQHEQRIASSFRRLFFLSDSEHEYYRFEIHLLVARFLQTPGFKETREAYTILDTIMCCLPSIEDFFQHNQSNVITAIETLQDPRISLAKGVDKEIEARFINMLHIRYHALRYYQMFPDSTRGDEWWEKLDNPGYRSMSRIPAYAKINGLPLEPTRRALKIGLKMLAIEDLAPGPGAALVLIPIWNNLASISYLTVKRICEAMVTVDAYEDIVRVIHHLSEDVHPYQRRYERHFVFLSRRCNRSDGEDTTTQA